MNWKEQLKDYFQFTLKDRIAALLVGLVLIVVLLYPHFAFKHNLSTVILTDSSWIDAAKNLVSDTSAILYSPYNNPERHPIVEISRTPLFAFDPNTLDQEGWSKLGIPDKTSRTISNFLVKGGRFREAADLRRIYGFRETDYQRLAPYIRIRQTDFNKVARDQPSEIKISPPRSFPHRIQSLDINTADTSAFIALPGIGPSLAKRIINFRTKLGGFYSITQISETFGLADSVYQKILPFLLLNNAFIKKINLNSCSLQDLKDHPYIRYQIGNAILAYKSQHGAFKNIEDIKNIMAITDEIYQKIHPYLEL